MSLTLDWMATLDQIREESVLDPDRLDALERLADSLPPAVVDEARAAAEARLPERGVHRGLHYLIARLAARRGDRESGQSALDRLLERLNQDRDYTLLVEVARRNAEWFPGERLLPLIVRAARESPQSVSDEVLAEMLDLYPEDPRLLWINGLRGMTREPAAQGAVSQLARALVYLAHDAEPDELEEAVLPVVDALDSENAPEMVAMVAALIERGRIDDAAVYLELAMDGLLAHGQAATLWELLRTALSRAPDAPLRPAALAALRRLRGDEKNHEQVITDSGLARSDVPFTQALARYERLMEFLPGSYVEHGSWGVGEILAHDGETLTVRFVSRPEHVFKRSLADRALERRERDDLRVLSTFFPERLAELSDRDPAGLVVVALRSLGGEAKPRELKRHLSPAVVPAEGWSEWWKRARATLDDDERIDTTQSFRDVIRLAVAGDGDEVPLPNLSERGDIGRQLKLLRRFLDQHPDARQRARRAHGRRLERWLQARSLSHENRILVLILFAEWNPEARDRLRDGLVEICREGFSLAAFPDERDQRFLLELGLEAEEWEPVAMAALDSKHLPLRQQVIGTVEERLGAAATRFYRRALETSPARGDAVVEVARAALSEQTAALAQVPAVDLLIALLRLVSEPERETLRKYAWNLLDADGPLFARLARDPTGRAETEMVELALLNFRASDKYLFPILASLERIWGASVIEALRRRRERESRVIAARMEDGEGELPVGLMTRASLEALRAEAGRVELELRTTIPRAIQKAREHGDLSENAEYDSAKLKQRTANERLAMLQRLIAEAQVIEELEFDSSCVQAGAEVTLEPLDEGGDPLVYWVLGDGDSHHGPEVISYRAELGRALWRRRPGELVELPLREGRRPFRIARIVRRLPTS